MGEIIPNVGNQWEECPSACEQLEKKLPGVGDWVLKQSPGVGDQQFGISLAFVIMEKKIITIGDQWQKEFPGVADKWEKVCTGLLFTMTVGPLQKVFTYQLPLPSSFLLSVPTDQHGNLVLHTKSFIQVDFTLVMLIV